MKQENGSDIKLKSFPMSLRLAVGSTIYYLNEDGWGDDHCLLMLTSMHGASRAQYVILDGNRCGGEPGATYTVRKISHKLIVWDKIEVSVETEQVVGVAVNDVSRPDLVPKDWYAGNISYMRDGKLISRNWNANYINFWETKGLRLNPFGPKYEGSVAAKRTRRFD